MDARRVGVLLWPLAALALGAWPGRAAAQGGGATIGFQEFSPFVISVRPVVRNGAVGGVSVDADGLVRQATEEATGELRAQWQAALAPAGDDLAAASPLRKVSLARLEAALAERLAHGERPDDDMLLLAGLNRVTHVLAYPDARDIVIAGPAEGWKVDAAGHVVGRQSGRPVLQLADLAVALCTAGAAARAPISCSIDPTDEGLSRLRHWLERAPEPIDDAALAQVEEALGPQRVTVTGVPAASHLARVLVAADYRMKLLAMGLVPSPVPELASYPELLAKSSRRPPAGTMPRWWLAPTCESIVHDQGGLAWELRGLAMRCLTEDNYVSAAGGLKPTGRQSDLAVRWAEAFTDAYHELSARWPVLAELEASVDLAVVGAMVARHDLRGATGCELAILGGLDLDGAEFAAPRATDSRASLVSLRRGTLLLVSGGVEIDGWALVEAASESDGITAARASAPRPTIPAGGGTRW